MKASHNTQQNHNLNLRRASACSQFERVRSYLSGSRMNVNEPGTFSKKTALHRAAASEDNSLNYYKTMELLLENGANPTLTDQSGKTPFNYFMLRMQGTNENDLKLCMKNNTIAEFNVWYNKIHEKFTGAYLRQEDLNANNAPTTKLPAFDSEGNFAFCATVEEAQSFARDSGAGRVSVQVCNPK